MAISDSENGDRDDVRGMVSRLSPYLQAYEVYHADGEPFLPWAAVVDFHLQAGVVIADEERFIMARRVDPQRAEEHALLVDHGAEGDCWHVWAAAGRLSGLLELGRAHGAERVTFQRRDGRLHAYALARFASPAMAKRAGLR